MSMDATTINGHHVLTHEHRNHRVPSHARRFAATLDRDHPAVERIDYGTRHVTVWIDEDNRRESFEIPNGWVVYRAGAYSGAVALDLERTDE